MRPSSLSGLCILGKQLYLWIIRTEQLRIITDEIIRLLRYLSNDDIYASRWQDMLLSETDFYFTDHQTICCKATNLFPPPILKFINYLDFHFHKPFLKIKFGAPWKQQSEFWMFEAAKMQSSMTIIYVIRIFYIRAELQILY